jgi:putative transposase
MPGPRPQEITLTPVQRTLLERVVRARTSPQALVRRAEMVLAADAGERNEPIARRLGSNREQVRAWRRRWAEAAPRLAALEESGAKESVLMKATADALADLPRSGRPPAFMPEEVCQILALACTDPVESGREVTHWTPAELAEEAVARGIVKSISRRTVGRFFDRRRSSRTASVIGSHR